jgi:hypothetical protein
MDTLNPESKLASGPAHGVGGNLIEGVRIQTKPIVVSKSYFYFFESRRKPV